MFLSSRPNPPYRLTLPHSSDSPAPLDPAINAHNLTSRRQARYRYSNPSLTPELDATNQIKRVSVADCSTPDQDAIANVPRSPISERFAKLSLHRPYQARLPRYNTIKNRKKEAQKSLSLTVVPRGQPADSRRTVMSEELMDRDTSANSSTPNISLTRRSAKSAHTALDTISDSSGVVRSDMSFDEAVASSIHDSVERRDRTFKSSQKALSDTHRTAESSQFNHQMMSEVLEYSRQPLKIPTIDHDMMDRAALTWQADEITGHDIDHNVSDDDGEGINGIGFRPTPAIAFARSQKRREQVIQWRLREAKEARQKRMNRRRGVQGSERVPTCPKRNVRFVNDD